MGVIDLIPPAVLNFAVVALRMLPYYFCILVVVDAQGAYLARTLYYLHHRCLLRLQCSSAIVTTLGVATLDKLAALILNT